MNQYVTGEMVRRLRGGAGLTQNQLAERIGVSEKTVSKWETGRGYPDVSLIETLAAALGVSVIELFAGKNVVNTNNSESRSFSFGVFFYSPFFNDVFRFSGTRCALLARCMALPSYVCLRHEQAEHGTSLRLTGATSLCRRHNVTRVCNLVFRFCCYGTIDM